VLRYALNLTRAQRGVIGFGDTGEATARWLNQTGSHASEGPPDEAAHTMIDAARATGHIYMCADWPHDASWARVALPALAPPVARSRLALPLRIDDQSWGVLYLDAPCPNAFEQDDLAFLHILGAHAATHMAHARLLQASEHARAQARQIEHLNQIRGVLTRNLDLAHVLRVIIESVNTLLGTERTSVFLVDELTNDLVLRYTNEGDSSIRLPAPWQGIAGWVAANDTPAIVNDAAADPRHLWQMARDLEYQAHAILCVPLRVDTRVIGVVEALNRVDQQPFTAHDRELLTEFTQWAAIAVHNARLFDDRKRAYQDLAAEQQRRTAAEARGAMAAVVLDIAHTMNNIIGAIRVWTKAIEQELSGTQIDQWPVVQAHLHRIAHNAEEALDLIRTLRAPLENAVLEPTNVVACLQTALQSCWFPANLVLAADLAADLPPVRANPSRLENAFQNIITNAVQALGSQPGTITVEAHTTRDDYVTIRIADDGPGIAPEVQDRLFSPGVSNKDGRLGIGLWLVETFIRQFGGQISWQSAAGAGTAFTIVLLPFDAPSDELCVPSQGV
jgi:signal transduction histidine kinase